MTGSRRRRALAPVAIAVALLCQACGAGDSTPSGSRIATIPTRSIPPAARSSDPGSERITVRIAYVGDYSLEEAASLVAPGYQGASLAAERATEAGTLPADVEVVSYNTDGDPQKALDVAGELAADAQIVGVMFAPFTAETRAVGEVLDAAGLPTISLSSLDSTLSNNGWMDWRRAVAPDSVQVRALAAFARGLPDAREGVCLAGDGSPRAVSLAKVAAAQLGGEAITRVGVPPADASAAKGAEAVRRAGCGVVLWTGYGTQAAALRTRLAASGHPVELLATDAAKTEAFLTEAGRAGDGTVVACACVDVTTSPRLDAQRFVNAFQFDIGASPGPYAVEGWDAGAQFVNAIRAGALTRQEASADLEGVRRYQGLGGSYAFARSGELAPSSAVIRFYRAEGGRWIALGSEDGSGPFTLRTAGKLTVGSCHWGTPFAVRRGGRLLGFDVAVAERLASRMGLRLDWRRLGCGNEAQALANGRVDALADVGRPGPPGSEDTRIYLSLRQSLAAARGSGIRGVEDLRAGDALAVVRGSAADRWARPELSDRGVYLRRVSLPRRAFWLLRRRRVAAVLSDASLAASESERHGIRIVAPSVDVGEYRVFAVARDNPGLLAAVDGELAELVRSGSYRREHRRWFPGAPIPAEVGST